MIKHYLTIAWRTVMRQKSYAAINIFGLTLGMVCFLLIVLYIVDETSYDNFHPRAEQIYRVIFSGRLQGRDFTSVNGGLPMAEAMQNEIPAVESTVRFTRWNTYPVRYEDRSFTEKRFALADSNFFEFFNFPLIAGSASDVLRGPNKIVITERAARRLFDYQGPGDTRPLGKMLVLGSKGETTAMVTGIAADPPARSSIQFDMVMSLMTWKDGLRNAIWLNSNVQTFFKLREGASLSSVDDKYKVFIEKYCGQELERFLNTTLAQFLGQGGQLGYSSQALLDIHLKSHYEDELEPGGNIQYVYLFGAVAVFILLLACINFMNLSTARSANRAREVGVRKAVGALRGKLIGQFLLESYAYTTVSVLLALAALALVLPSFNLLTGKSLDLSVLSEPAFMGVALLVAGVIGAVAGSYPAFYLTAFQPSEVLKGKLRSGMRSSGIRNTLVVFQFFISIALIIGTIVVYRQLQFVQHKNLGYNRENVLNLLHTIRLEKNGEAFKNELLQHPEIIGASYCNRVPPNVDWNSTFQIPQTQQSHLLSIYVVDYDHLKAMGLEMVKGRFFSRDFLTDSTAFLMNETAAQQLGMNDFEGKTLLSYNNSEKGTIIHAIGIIRDFNYSSLHNAIGPLVIMLAPQPYWEMAIRLTPGDQQEKLKLVEGIWKKYAPDAPFEYSFVDENYDLKFRAEQRMGQVFVLFTSLAIAIACLGLFGLATFTAEQRAKEIGIRKALGATIPQVMSLLTMDFARLVAVAFVLAVPLMWWSMTNWLQTFAYRTDFEWEVLLWAGGLAMTVAIATVSFQSLKAAVANPVKSLRSE
ncbi:MAG: ABC transporter permease [Cyclobacteriaceae bacterium]|nr:ABC transporter permease [Cyclobacteriaceae bacterium]